MNTRSKKTTSSVNVQYLETLRKCTKTVIGLYTKYVSSFPEEYIALVSSISSPNGTILRIPMNQKGTDIKIKIMRYEKFTEFTDDDVFGLVNSWVYLEDGQTPLNYLQLYFKYIIAHFGITKYRLKQMYQELELDEEDDHNADPDYHPELDEDDYDEELEYTEDEDSYSIDGDDSIDSIKLDTSEFEFRNHEEPCESDDDSDNSPDYVPSVESEDEYENTHPSVVRVTKKRTIRKIRNVKTVH